MCLERAGECEAPGFCAVQRRARASRSVWRALRKGQVTAEGERRERKRSVKVLYTPLHQAPAAAVPGPSNESLFRKKSKLSLWGGEGNLQVLTPDRLEKCK